MNDVQIKTIALRSIQKGLRNLLERHNWKRSFYIHATSYMLSFERLSILRPDIWRIISDGRSFPAPFSFSYLSKDLQSVFHSIFSLDKVKPYRDEVVKEIENLLNIFSIVPVFRGKKTMEGAKNIFQYQDILKPLGLYPIGNRDENIMLYRIARVLKRHDEAQQQFALEKKGQSTWHNQLNDLSDTLRKTKKEFRLISKIFTPLSERIIENFENLESIRLELDSNFENMWHTELWMDYFHIQNKILSYHDFHESKEESYQEILHTTKTLRKAIDFLANKEFGPSFLHHKGRAQNYARSSFIFDALSIFYRYNFWSTSADFKKLGIEVFIESPERLKELEKAAHKIENKKAKLYVYNALKYVEPKLERDTFDKYYRRMSSRKK